MTKESIVAVIGQILGPWVYTGRLATPVLEVIGSELHVVQVELAHGPREQDRFKSLLTRERRTVLEPAAFVRVQYLEGTCERPICKIHSR